MVINGRCLLCVFCATPSPLRCSAHKASSAEQSFKRKLKIPFPQRKGEED